MTKQHMPTIYYMITQNSITELADNADGKFKRYWKQIGAYGDWVDPRGGKSPMKLNKEFCQGLADNFKSGVGGFIPVPLGHPQTDAELAEQNKGELVDVEARDDAFYGLVEIRDTSTSEKIDNKLIPDVSMSFTDNYQDKKTGNWVGATLRHIGLVVNPYLKGMTEFEPALSENSSNSVLFSDNVEIDPNNNKEEENIMGDVKNERDFEVAVKYTENGQEKEAKIAAGESLSVPTDQVESVTKQIADAVAPDANNGGPSDEDQKAKELSDREAAVSKREAELSEQTADAEYKTLLSEGKIVPAQEAAFKALKSCGSTNVELSDGVSKTVDVLLSEFLEKAPKLDLSEQGKNNGDGGEDDGVELSDEEKSLADNLHIDHEEMKKTKKEMETK